MEVPGIEPGSFVVLPGLLRAQPALPLLGSGDHAGEFTVTSPVALVSLPVPRPYRKVSFLADAEHRGGSIPGSTDFSTPPQAARAKSVRLALALITLPRWLTRSRDILGPLPLVRRTKSKPFTPMLSCQRLNGLARSLGPSRLPVSTSGEPPRFPRRHAAAAGDRRELLASNIVLCPPIRRLVDDDHAHARRHRQTAPVG